MGFLSEEAFVGFPLLVCRGVVYKLVRKNKEKEIKTYSITHIHHLF